MVEGTSLENWSIYKISWVRIPLYPFLKAKNGIEPLFKDLQSFTLTVMLFSLFVNYNYEK